MMGCNSSSDSSSNTSSTDEVVVRYVQADSLASTIKQNKDILVVDVREGNEYKTGYIKDAINVPSAQFDNDNAKSSLLDHIKVIISTNNNDITNNYTVQ